MNIRDRYKKTFNIYYDSVLNDEEVLRMIDQRCSSPKKHLRHRLAAAALASVLLVLSTTCVFAAVGWLNLSDIFRTNDPVSAKLADAGIVQELGIVGESDDYTLKLAAFTGDLETQKVLFEMIPKKNLGDLSDYELRLAAQTSSPQIMEEQGWVWGYASFEAPGSKVTADDSSEAYYFNFELPEFWIKGTAGDVAIRVLGIKLYNKSQLVGMIGSEILYTFTPDRSILQEPVVKAVNQLIAKDVFDDFVSYPYDDDYEYYKGEITAPVKNRSLMIDSITFSSYKAEIKARIMEEDIHLLEASSIWDQFTEPAFATKHYLNGINDRNAYQMAIVENAERLRLFVDGVERPLFKERFHISPGRGEDGYFSCSIRFEGFDYQNAKKIEIRFGDKVIAIK